VFSVYIIYIYIYIYTYTYKYLPLLIRTARFNTLLIQHTQASPPLFSVYLGRELFKWGILWSVHFAKKEKTNKQKNNNYKLKSAKKAFQGVQKKEHTALQLLQAFFMFKCKHYTQKNVENVKKPTVLFKCVGLIYVWILALSHEYTKKLLETTMQQRKEVFI